MSQGQVITFYSYKGGTGRTMALANVATVLARQQRVLMIDWDLEAPGLHYFFTDHLDQRNGVLQKPGLIEYFTEVHSLLGNHVEWQHEESAKDLFAQIYVEDYLHNISSNRLFLFAAGSYGENYAKQVTTFQWESLFNRAPWLFRAFAHHLTDQFDYILIDSRTGLNDTSGICTSLMPEKLVAVFTPNRQSTIGVIKVVRDALEYRRASDDLRPLLVFPLASRLEYSEMELFKKWESGSEEEGIAGYQNLFEAQFKDSYGLKECDLHDYFDEVKIQHQSTFLYGERIAVLDNQITDRLYVGKSYEIVAERLVDGAAPWRNVSIILEHDLEFVDREIELATLDPTRFYTSYWQLALVSAPTGYGKTRLLKRIIDGIQNTPELNRRWNCCYIDLKSCDELEEVITFIVKEITGQTVAGDINGEKLKSLVCNHILETMSMSITDGMIRGILLVVDAIEYLNSSATEWFSSIIHDVVVGSYIDYERDEASFPVRLILSGTNTDAFWKEYKKWEVASNRRNFLRAPQNLHLSPFKKIHVEELIFRRAKKGGISIGYEVISDIADKLLYLSGGHPAVISGILNELFAVKFLLYQEYLKHNRQRLIKKYVSGVAKRMLYPFPSLQTQNDIKTLCVFRLIDLNTLRKLRSEELVTSGVDISLLGLLCENNILRPPSAEKLFYHDDIIRRILYLDFAFGTNQFSEHIQKIHRCAMDYYYQKLFSKESEQLSSYFVEWLFHALQVTDLPTKNIVEAWKILLSGIQSTSVIPDDLRNVIRDELERDSEVKYLYDERFGSEDFLSLFDL